MRAKKIVLDALSVRAEFHRVDPLRQIKVFVELKGIPSEFKGRRHDDASRKRREAVVKLQRTYADPGIKTKLWIGCRRVDRLRPGWRCGIVTVESHAERIQQLRIENVAPFQGKGLAFALIADELVIHL